MNYFIIFLKKCFLSVNRNKIETKPVSSLFISFASLCITKMLYRMIYLKTRDSTQCYITSPAFIYNLPSYTLGVANNTATFFPSKGQIFFAGKCRSIRRSGLYKPNPRIGSPLPGWSFGSLDIWYWMMSLIRFIRNWRLVSFLLGFSFFQTMKPL